MPFSDEVRRLAYVRASGHCGCTREVCNHGRVCGKPLGADWHAHYRRAVDDGGDDTLPNCEALCLPCHHNTGPHGPNS